MKLIPIMILAFVSAAHAQVYKCPGANGATVYSDTPCSNGQTMRRSALSGNTVEKQQPRGSDAPRAGQAAEAAPTGVLPTPRQLRDMETRASARVFPTNKERDFLQDELARMRAAAAGGGAYTKADWLRLEELHAAQNRIEPRERETARMEAERIHAVKGHAPIVSAPTAPSPQLVNCDSAGCWGTNGVRYNKVAGGFFGSDGKFCPLAGTIVLPCQ